MYDTAIMFNFINRYKQQRRRKYIRNLTVISTISAGLGAVAALFLNNKENRDKIVNTAKVVRDKTVEESKKAYSQASGRISEFSGKATDVGSKFMDTIRNKFQKDESEKATKEKDNDTV